MKHLIAILAIITFAFTFAACDFNGCNGRQVRKTHRVKRHHRNPNYKHHKRRHRNPRYKHRKPHRRHRR